MKKHILLIALFSFIASAASAALPTDSISKSIMNEKVIVGSDTVNLVMPEFNIGRYHRGLFNYLFMPKKQWAFGLTASYGEFSTEDVQILQTVTDFNFKGKQYSIKPSVGYFFRNNQCIGVKFDYTRAEADLGSLALDLGDDLSFSVRDVSYYSSKYAIGAYYRNYVGLGRARRFAVFNEVALNFGSGSGRFQRYYENHSQLRDTRTNVTEASLNFSPGLCVFIVDNLSFNISFGVFGVYFRDEKQTTNYVTSVAATESEPAHKEVKTVEGSRFSSGANFRFNLFNINFGISVHI